MSNKGLVLTAFLFAVAIVVYSLWPSDESRIRKVFREGARAVEQKKVEDVMAKISFNYSDEHGLSYLILRKGVEKAFSEMDNFNVEYEIKKLNVNNENAAAEVDVRVVATKGKETGYIVGDAAKPARIKFSLETLRTKWLIIRTEGMPSFY